MSSNSCDIFIIIFACKNIYYYLPILFYFITNVNMFSIAACASGN